MITKFFKKLFKGPVRTRGVIAVVLGIAVYSTSYFGIEPEIPEDVETILDIIFPIILASLPVSGTTGTRPIDPMSKRMSEQKGW